MPPPTHTLSFFFSSSVEFSYRAEAQIRTRETNFCSNYDLHKGNPAMKITESHISTDDIF